MHRNAIGCCLSIFVGAIAVLALILPAQAAKKHLAGVKYEDITANKQTTTIKTKSKIKGKTGFTTNRVRNDPYKNFKFR